MRVVQIIDSLDAGGAERMAVNYANVLSSTIDFSALIATRKEGVLQQQLNKNVPYLFLRKKRAFDLKALFLLRNFVKINKIEIVHAHGTSFFTGFLLKLIYPKIKLIWHEHLGARVEENSFRNLVLIVCSFLFDAVFVVNQDLKIWMESHLWTKKVTYIPNFTNLNTNELSTNKLNGNAEKRIICVSNLKNPKNHILLLNAFLGLNLSDLGWSLHLIGKDFKDNYSDEIKKFIVQNNLENSVSIYDSKKDIFNLLNQATIGVLCSTSEGFPITLLEYGLAKLPVISTNVGECSTLINDSESGLLFDPKNLNQLQEQIFKLISNKNLRDKLGLNLYQTVTTEYSKEKIIDLIVSKYNKVLIRC
jgi:glycosyltransferase involved in cell wall biosynthesis